jgi:hypothetical protein
LLAAVNKSTGRAWSDTDITELLSFRPKSILAGDLNTKIPFWNRAVSNPSGDKLLHLFDVNQFEISVPQCPTHYSPSGNCDVLDIVVRQNIRLSDVIVSDILDSDHLPILFHILDHVKIRNLSDPIEKFTDWDRFQNLASELISPKIAIKLGVEADKAKREFSASIDSAYRLSASKITLLDLNNDLPGLDRLLRQKKRLRKLWQETRDPACRAAVNWVSKAIRRMTRRRALERWETKIGNAEVTPKAIWPIAKSLLTRDAIHGASGLKFIPSEKANAIADCLEMQFTPHDLCDENHERQVEAIVQALLATVEKNPLKR